MTVRKGRAPEPAAKSAVRLFDWVAPGSVSGWRWVGFLCTHMKNGIAGQGLPLCPPAGITSAVPAWGAGLAQPGLGLGDLVEPLSPALLLRDHLQVTWEAIDEAPKGGAPWSTLWLP